MASLDKRAQSHGSAAVGGRAHVGSPVSNEAYNVITALQAKLEGLEAYRKYTKDDGASPWSELAKLDLEAVGVLLDELESLVQDGKLRMEE